MYNNLLIIGEFPPTQLTALLNVADKLHKVPHAHVFIHYDSGTVLPTRRKPSDVMLQCRDVAHNVTIAVPLDCITIRQAEEINRLGLPIDYNARTQHTETTQWARVK